MNLIKQISSKTLLRNTLWMMGGSGVRLILQAVYFLLIARTLGVGQYGAFVGSVSLVALAAPFSSWGTGFLLIKNVSLDRTKFKLYWGTALTSTVIAGCFLICFIAIISFAIWGKSIPVGVLLLVGISDIIVVRIIELSAQAFTAIEILQKNAELYIVLSIARTIAAALLAFGFRSPTAMSWAWLYLFSALIAMVYGNVVVTHHLGLPKVGFHLSRQEIKEGFYFAVSQSSQTIYNDIDKTMLVRFGGLAATGIYGAAYRIVDVSFAPVGALVYAAFAKFFQHGERGLAGSIGFAKKLIGYSSCYGFIVAILLFVCSPILPVLLGKDFASAALALRWLSPLVFIKSIHYFLADSLTGAGFQGVRASIQVGIVVVNVFLNLWLIPAYSWKGAAWASLAADGALALGLLAAIVFLSKKSESIKCMAEWDPT